MAIGPLVQRLDANGNTIYARPPSGHVNARVLAGAAESVTVPTGAKIAVFSATADFYANATATAAAATDIDNGTASELNPSVWDVTGLTSISLFGTASVTVAFYS